MVTIISLKAPQRNENRQSAYRSGELLCLDGLTVAEGHLNVIGSIDRNEVYQPVEAVETELCDLIGQFLESPDEVFVVAFLRLKLADLLIQFVKPVFEGFVPGGEVIVLFW